VSTRHHHHRPPRAGVDPITDDSAALVTIGLAMHDPPRPETIVLMLDERRCGIALVVVSGTTRPDDVLEVVECLTRPAATAERVDAIVVASVRPGHDATLGDGERWPVLADLAEQHGVELVEWFVIGRTIIRPREAAGARPRW
jgi:hypothetical protein